jgi:hypothetical protein
MKLSHSSGNNTPEIYILLNLFVNLVSVSALIY